MKTPDIYMKEMEGSEAPVGLSWEEYCLQYPKEAAIRLRLMQEDLIKLYPKEDYIMNNVIMFITGDASNVMNFDTVKEAQDYAESLGEGDEFSVFTLYTKGTRSGITWETQVDTGTNLREIKKTEIKGKRSGGTWSVLEEETLMTSYRSKMPIRQIAEALGRSYNACYCKINAIKKKKKDAKQKRTE